MATREDAEDRIFPYAFTIVEGENRECWLQFLKNVHKTIYPTYPMCIISKVSEVTSILFVMLSLHNMGMFVNIVCDILLIILTTLQE